MSNLEDMIRDLAKRGELSHVSVALNGSGTQWRASFAPCSVFGVTFAEDKDPVKALTLAMEGTKLKRRAPSKRNAEKVDEVADLM